MEKERLRLMVKVCQLYYQDGLSQKEIANQIGISRPQISRIISAAKSEGIVEITINNPFSKESTFEKELISRFHLKNAVVVDTTDLDREAANTSFASAGSIYFESVVNDNDIVGVMAGKSITSLINKLDRVNKKNLNFVPLVGGWGPQGANWHSNTNVTQLAKKTNGNGWILHAPAIVSSNEIHNNIINEPQIKKVIDLSKQANIALVGIGQMSDHATFFQSMNLTQNQLNDILDAGTVASICTTFINENGEEVSTEFSKRMIGIPSNDLKNVPLVIGFAKGNSKVEAIHASLKGNWLDVLITDLDTAKQIIQRDNFEEETK